VGDRSVTRNSGADLARVGAGLPVAAYRDEITTALQGRRAVIVAPPGTGKTTFVPPLVASRCSGRVIVTQPRRVAARAAARRLATLTGTRPGAFASHTVRGESTTTRDTKVEFVTTGVLLRRLLNDPDLTGVDAVILDEVHERHLDADLVVAMVCAANAPGRVPVSVASRRAAALAATRRGWVTMTRPEHLEATKGGTNVVLPVPGGATMTARLPCKAGVISSRYAATGSPAPTLARSGPEFLVTERSPTPASPCHRGDQERWPRQQSDRSSPQRERQPATTAWQESPTMSQPRFQRSSSLS